MTRRKNKRVWTAGERHDILAMAACGIEYQTIADRFGTTKSAVCGMVYRARQVPRARPWRKTKPKLYVHFAAVAMDSDMAARVDAFRGKLPRSQALRELIEWGLEAYENELPGQRD